MLQQPPMCIYDWKFAWDNRFGLTSRIIISLLQTLLADDIAKDYSELDFKLSQVILTVGVTWVCFAAYHKSLNVLREKRRGPGRC